jgi:hypothetical protein
MNSNIKSVRFETLINEPKKMKAIFYDTNGSMVKSVKFGASGYSDFTMHKDPNRKRLYELRHRHDNLDDYTSPGSLSMDILWGPSISLETNILKYKQKNNLK